MQDRVGQLSNRIEKLSLVAKTMSKEKIQYLSLLKSMGTVPGHAYSADIRVIKSPIVSEPQTESHYVAVVISTVLKR